MTRTFTRVLAALCCTAALSQAAGAVDAKPTTNPIYIDGKQVTLDSYTINGFTYYKIRDLAEVLPFEVGYDTSTDSILMWSGQTQVSGGSSAEEEGDTGVGTSTNTGTGQGNILINDPSFPGFVPDQTGVGTSGSVVESDPEHQEQLKLDDLLTDAKMPDPSNPGSSRGIHDGKLVVLLDPGHGGTDIGTKSRDSKYFERDFNNAVAIKVRALLEAHGVEVYLTRDPETNEGIEPAERVLRIEKCLREHPVDLLLSIHHNAVNGKATGSEVLVQVAYEKGGPGQELAACIESQYRSLGRPIRPTKYQYSKVDQGYDYQYLLRAASNRDLLAVMSEYCFLDVPSELQLVLTEEGQQKEAEALVAAVLQYYTTHPY